MIIVSGSDAAPPALDVPLAIHRCRRTSMQNMTEKGATHSEGCPTNHFLRTSQVKSGFTERSMRPALQPRARSGLLLAELLFMKSNQSMRDVNRPMLLLFQKKKQFHTTGTNKRIPKSRGKKRHDGPVPAVKSALTWS